MLSHTDKNRYSYDTHAESWESATRTNVGHKYLEKPAMTALLPVDLHDSSVLCIGVGSGEELEELFRRSAKDITAIDISSELLQCTKKKFPLVTCREMDMTDLSFPDESFDFVYSSLALHYADDWDRLLSGIYRVMKKGGALLFSTHRPEYWKKKERTGNHAVNERGVMLTEHTDILPGGVEIFFYNHTGTDAILESLSHAGFTLRSVITPSMVELDTTETDIKEHFATLKRKNEENPLFLVIAATK